jgi:hypothetical protein
LIDALREEITVTQADKDEVKDIMKALLNFGFVSESTEIHSLVEKLMRASNTCASLLSVEQERFLEKANSLQLDVIGAFTGMSKLEGVFNRQQREEDSNKALAEWRDIKFFKH